MTNGWYGEGPTALYDPVQGAHGRVTGVTVDLALGIPKEELIAAPDSLGRMLESAGRSADSEAARS